MMGETPWSGRTWSNGAMAKRYQHPMDEMRIDIANRVGGLLWGGNRDGSRKYN
jgi:hypothetical protein